MKAEIVLEDLLDHLRENTLSDVEFAQRVARACISLVRRRPIRPLRFVRRFVSSERSMTRESWITVGGFLLLTASHLASAQTVYRCGNIYQDHPCPGAAIIDAQPNTGVEVRSPTGAVVHSREGDKARNARQLEVIRDIQRNALACAAAGEKATAKNNRIECRTTKAQDDAERLTPDYIRK